MAEEIKKYALKILLSMEPSPARIQVPRFKHVNLLSELHNTLQTHHSNRNIFLFSDYTCQTSKEVNGKN